jgi:hypothetical protein
MPRTVP